MQTTDDAHLADSFFSSDRDRGSNAAPPAATTPEPVIPSAPPAPPATDGKQVEAAAPEAEEPSYEGVDPTGRMVPLAEYLGNRRKYKGKWEEAKAEAEKTKQELDILRKQNEQLLQGFRQQPQPAQQQQVPQQQEETPPDPYLDPVAYADWREAKLEQKAEAQRLGVDYNLACIKAGDEKVNAAITAARQQGPGFLYSFSKRSQPHLDLVKWHAKHLADQEIGGDLEAYKKKIADEAVAAALANLQNGGVPPKPAQAQAAQPQQAFPGSLSHVSAAGAPVSNEASLEGIFDTNRKRRA